MTDAFFSKDEINNKPTILLFKRVFVKGSYTLTEQTIILTLQNSNQTEYMLVIRWFTHKPWEVQKHVVIPI